MKRIILTTALIGMITAGATAQVQTPGSANSNTGTSLQQASNNTNSIHTPVISAQPGSTGQTSSGTLIQDHPAYNNGGTNYPSSHTRNTQRTNANSINPNTTPITTPPGNNGILNNGTLNSGTGTSTNTVPGQTH